HKKFKAEVYVLTKEEGGRHTPYFNGYRPQFYFRTTDVTGVCTLPQGVEMVMPGDNVAMAVELITPIAMEKELRFAIREGGRTVGAGVGTEVVGEGGARRHGPRGHQVGLRRPPASERDADEEAAEAGGTAGAQEVLPVVPEAHRAQGNEVGRTRAVALTARAPDSKSGGWGFESLLPCHIDGDT